jgi:hypothetical protein
MSSAIMRTAINKLKECRVLLGEEFSGKKINILQPGFIKECVMSSVNGHRVETEKHLCDAYDEKQRQLEYLTCQEDSINQKTGKKLTRAFAIDGIFSSPPESKTKSLNRILRNYKIFYGIFEDGGGLDMVSQYVGCPKDLADFVDKNITRRGMTGKNTEHTVNIPKSWVIANCTRIPHK